MLRHGTLFYPSAVIYLCSDMEQAYKTIIDSKIVSFSSKMNMMDLIA
jgi:hypothetical protein